MTNRGIKINTEEQKIIHMIKVCILILGISTFLAICVISEYLGGYKKLIEITSPNNENTISIQYKPATLVGPTPIKIVSEKSVGKRNFVLDYKTEVHNNGATLYVDESTIEWIDNNKAIVTLSGSEQRDKIIEINFQKSISYKLIQDTKLVS